MDVPAEFRFIFPEAYRPFVTVQPVNVYPARVGLEIFFVASQWSVKYEFDVELFQEPPIWIN